MRIEAIQWVNAPLEHWVLRAALGGSSPVSPAALAETYEQVPRVTVPLPPRELDMLGCTARGVNNAATCPSPFLSEPTLRTVAKAPLAKSGARNHGNTVDTWFVHELLTAGDVSGRNVR